jgi:hypothetical protein
MVVGDGFLPEALDVHEPAFIVVFRIALASHTARAVLLEVVKIIVDRVLGRVLPAGGYRKGHDIPYHITWVLVKHSRL